MQRPGLSPDIFFGVTFSYHLFRIWNLRILYSIQYTFHLGRLSCKILSHLQVSSRYCGSLCFRHHIIFVFAASLVRQLISLSTKFYQSLGVFIQTFYNWWVSRYEASRYLLNDWVRGWTVIFLRCVCSSRRWFCKFLCCYALFWLPLLIRRITLLQMICSPSKSTDICLRAWIYYRGSVYSL